LKGLLISCLFFTLFTSDKVRFIEYNGKPVRTTFHTPDKFYGTYKGRKAGFLILNQDGSGEYRYDVFGFAPASCKKVAIPIEWGFLVDDKGDLVVSDREYGKSYPILMKSTGTNSFQGCRKSVMLDFIMVYKNGQIGVSSSDDWVKAN